MVRSSENGVEYTEEFFNWITKTSGWRSFRNFKITLSYHILDVDEDEIKEIICTIFKNHIPREDSDENDQDIGGNDDDENAQ